MSDTPSLDVFQSAGFPAVREVGRNGYEVTYLVAPGDADVAHLVEDYVRLREAGLLDRAAVDMTGFSRDAGDLIRASYPGVMLLNGSREKGGEGGFDVEVLPETQDGWRDALLTLICRFALVHRAETAAFSDVLAGASAMSTSPMSFTHRPLDPDDSEGLLARLVRYVKDTPQYDAGAYRFHRAVEVMTARRTAERRSRVYGSYMEACRAAGKVPVDEADWRALWPRRILFSQDFETDGDWGGRLIEGPPSRRVAGAADNKWFAQFIRVGVNYDHARAATQTWVKFRYHLNRNMPLKVMAFDLTQKDNHWYVIEAPKVGRWVEVELDITRDFARADGSEQAMQAGDAIDDIFFSAGSPGDGEIELQIDDVLLIGRD